MTCVIFETISILCYTSFVAGVAALEHGVSTMDANDMFDAMLDTLLAQVRGMQIENSEAERKISALESERDALKADVARLAAESRLA